MLNTVRVLLLNAFFSAAYEYSQGQCFVLDRAVIVLRFNILVYHSQPHPLETDKAEASRPNPTSTFSRVHEISLGPNSKKSKLIFVTTALLLERVIREIS